MKTKVFLLTTALMAGTVAIAQAQSPNQGQTTSPPAKQTQGTSSDKAAGGNAGKAQRSQDDSNARSESNKSSDSTRSDSSKPDSDRSDAGKGTTGTSSTPGTANEQSRDQSRSSDKAQSPSRDRKSDDNVQARDRTNVDTSQSRDRSDNPSSARSNSDRDNRNSAGPDNRNDTNTSRSDTDRNQQTDRAGSTDSERSRSSANVDVNINEQQRTRVTQSISKLNVQPVTNVNFSVSVGTAVPRDVRLRTLPSDIVEVVPQYRGYSFFVVRDEVVIVEPSTHKIVTVLPRNGGGTAQTTTRQRVKFTDKDRETVRKYSRKSEPRTTGTAVRSRIGVGERVPASVELESFPDEVYTDAPSLREYRYLRQENRTYVIEPHERTIIEEID